MTEKQLAQWVKDNLGGIIRKALMVGTTPPIYTEDWLAAMVMRETGVLIMKKSAANTPSSAMNDAMVGDYGQRKKDKAKIYHGYGYWQIDIDSFPEFVASGDWKDPYKCCMMAIKVLEGKRKYLSGKLQGKVITANTEMANEIMNNFHRAITASYNCGEGNVWKCLKDKKDVDTYTFNHDYSKEIWRYREIYKALN